MIRMQPEILSFLHHEVTDDPASSGFQAPGSLSYKHTCRQFEDNLNRIADSDVGLAMVAEIDFSLKGRSILLTFDDGGKSAMHIADAIESRGWRGHFFVTTNQIGTRYFLSEAQIRDLHTRGHIIGAHSHNHPCPFQCLTKEQQVNEFVVSSRILADIIQEAVTTASIPGGDATRDTLRNIAETELRYCFTSEPTTTPIKINDTIFLGRVCPRRNTRPETVGQLARFRGLSRQKMVRVAKKIAKAVVYTARSVPATPVDRYEQG